MQAKNESGQSNTNIHLNVELPAAKAPVFLGKPRILKENNGRRIVFECDCEADQKPELSWTRNDEPVKSQGRHLADVEEAQQKGRFVLFLEIDNIEPKDAGLYKCTAKTSSGESVCSVDFKMAEEESPASFKEKPKDQVGVDGDRITVTCKVNGNPKVTWLKNKQPIQKSKVNRKTEKKRFLILFKE